MSFSIVNKGKWLWRSANVKEANEDAKIYVRRITNYVTETFLLVSYSDKTINLLCFVHDQGQKSEQKHGTKNFVGLHNHFALSSLVWEMNFLKVPEPFYFQPTLLYYGAKIVNTRVVHEESLTWIVYITCLTWSASLRNVTFLSTDWAASTFPKETFLKPSSWRISSSATEEYGIRNHTQLCRAVLW